jgi:hypothetical protein
MKVYHGSYIRIDKIDLSMCKPNKDFGKGFYVVSGRKLLFFQEFPKNLFGEGADF